MSEFNGPMTIVHVVAFALFAPFVLGWLTWLKAKLQRRRAAVPWQIFVDLYKLLRTSQDSTPPTASWLYRLVPPTVFFCHWSLSLALPPLGYKFVWVDLITVVYLLGLGRFMLALAGMDSSLPFGGLGSSREMFINVLTKPIFFLAILGFALLYKHANLTAIVFIGDDSLPFPEWVFALGVRWLLWFALLIIMLLEIGHVPAGNPHSPLELTKIDKALHLIYSGRNLALLQWADGMRLLFFVTLLGDLLVPRDLILPEMTGNWFVAIGLYVAKLFLLLVALALFETWLGKMRLRRLILPTAVSGALTFTAVLIAYLTIVLRAL